MIKRHLLNFGLIGLIFVLGLGWIVDRSLLKRKIAVSTKKTASLLSSPSSQISKLSEADHLFILRWADKQLLSRLTYHYNSLKKGKSSSAFEDFDQVLDRELVSCIVESFVLEKEANRRDIVPAPLSIAADAIQNLECDKPSEFFEIVDNLNVPSSVYPMLYESSAKHSEFRSFLVRVFEKAEELPRAGSRDD